VRSPRCDRRNIMLSACTKLWRTVFLSLFDQSKLLHASACAASTKYRNSTLRRVSVEINDTVLYGPLFVMRMPDHRAKKQILHWKKHYINFISLPLLMVNKVDHYIYIRVVLSGIMHRTAKLLGLCKRCAKLPKLETVRKEMNVKFAGDSGKKWALQLR